MKDGEGRVKGEKRRERESNGIFAQIFDWSKEVHLKGKK